jgi:hypothetical protein
MKPVLLSISAAACIAAATAATTSMPARADVEFPWCVISSSGGLGVPICDFATLEQCQVFIQGLTGFCRPNPKAVAGTKVAPARR